MPIDNYIVFCLPTEEDALVNVIRIMYGGRDIAAQLEEVDFLSDSKR